MLMISDSFLDQFGLVQPYLYMRKTFFEKNILCNGYIHFHICLCVLYYSSESIAFDTEIKSPILFSCSFCHSF